MRLMRAVMEQVFDSIKRNRGRQGRHAQRILKEDMEWVADDNQTYPFSFVSICYNLGLEPSQVRKAINRLMQGES